MAMIDPNGIMPLNFFKYKGVYTGQHNGMRYMLKQTGEKPDLKLSACVWRGPYASCAVKEEDKTTEIFELTEDGFQWLGDYEITADEELGGLAPDLTIGKRHRL